MEAYQAGLWHEGQRKLDAHRAQRRREKEERVKERRLNEQFRRQVAARHKKATGGADHPAAAGKKHAARAGTSKSLTGSGPVQHPNLWDE